MLKGLLDNPHINESTIDSLIKKINKNFIIENFEHHLNFAYINHIDTDLFVNPKTIYSLLNTEYIIKINDVVTLTHTNSMEESITISSWNDFKMICTLISKKSLSKISTEKIQKDPELDYEKLMNILINQSLSILISSLRESGDFTSFSEGIDQIENKEKSEKLQYLLERDDPTDGFIKKFVETYDLIYLMLYNLKYFFKNNPNEFEKIKNNLFI